MAIVEFAVRQPNSISSSHTMVPARPPTMVDYFGSKLPNLFQQLPSHEKRIESGPKYSMSTSAHEGNHYLLGVSLGYQPEYISVIPEGNTLGFVAFSGVGYEDFKVIAAGGRVDTVVGAAEGYGMDMFMIDLLCHLKGGMSKSEALGRAQGILKSIPDSLKKRFAEILAHKGAGNGDTAAEMLELAELELIWEQNKEVVESNWRENFFKTKEEAKAKEGTVVVETLVGGRYRITYVDGNGIKDSFEACGLCRGINSHAQNCPIRTQKDESQEGGVKPTEWTTSAPDALELIGEFFPEKRYTIIS